MLILGVIPHMYHSFWKESSGLSKLFCEVLLTKNKFPNPGSFSQLINLNESQLSVAKSSLYSSEIETFTHLTEAVVCGMQVKKIWLIRTSIFQSSDDLCLLRILKQRVIKRGRSAYLSGRKLCSKGDLSHLNWLNFYFPITEASNCMPETNIEQTRRTFNTQKWETCRDFCHKHDTCDSFNYAVIKDI